MTSSSCLRGAMLFWMGIVACAGQAPGPVRTAMNELRQVRASITAATDPVVQARHWMALNGSAERFAHALGDKEELKAQAREASAFGVKINWCEPAGSWTAGTEGYEKYLALASSGPQADEAWWKSRVESPCGDSEGSIEENQQVIETYSTFLAKFPKSKHAAEAREVLENTRRELKEQLKREKDAK